MFVIVIEEGVLQKKLLLGAARFLCSLVRGSEKSEWFWRSCREVSSASRVFHEVCNTYNDCVTWTVTRNSTAWRTCTIYASYYISMHAVRAAVHTE